MKTRKSKTGTKITAVAIAAAIVVGAIAIRRKQLFVLLMVGAVCLGASQSVQAQCAAKNEAFQHWPKPHPEKYRLPKRKRQDKAAIGRAASTSGLNGEDTMPVCRSAS